MYRSKLVEVQWVVDQWLYRTRAAMFRTWRQAMNHVLRNEQFVRWCVRRLTCRLGIDMLGTWRRVANNRIVARDSVRDAIVWACDGRRRVALSRWMRGLPEAALRGRSKALAVVKFTSIMLNRWWRGARIRKELDAAGGEKVTQGPCLITTMTLACCVRRRRSCSVVRS